MANNPDLEATIIQQSEQINRLTADLGILAEQLNKLAGSGKKLDRDPPPPAAPPAPPAQSVDPIQLLGLVRQAEERGQKSAVEMFEKVGGVMAQIQDALVKGMELAETQRSRHYDELQNLMDDLAPEPTDPPEKFDVSAAFKVAEQIKAYISGGGNGSAGAPVSPRPEGSE